MSDFKPAGKLTDSAKIRNLLEKIESFRSEGHSLRSIYEGLLTANVISCGWDNFTRVYYKERGGLAEPKPTPKTTRKQTTHTTNSTGTGILQGFDRNATIAQAKAVFNQSKET